MANKLHVIVQTMKKKKYDVLDARKDFFDNDFEEFKRSIDELHVNGFYMFPRDPLLVNSLRERGVRVLLIDPVAAFGALAVKSPLKMYFSTCRSLKHLTQVLAFKCFQLTKSNMLLSSPSYHDDLHG